MIWPALNVGADGGEANGRTGKFAMVTTGLDCGGVWSSRWWSKSRGGRAGARSWEDWVGLGPQGGGVNSCGGRESYRHAMGVCHVASIWDFLFHFPHAISIIRRLDTIPFHTDWQSWFKDLGRQTYLGPCLPPWQYAWPMKLQLLHCLRHGQLVVEWPPWLQTRHKGFVRSIMHVFISSY